MCAVREQSPLWFPSPLWIPTRRRARVGGVWGVMDAFDRMMTARCARDEDDDAFRERVRRRIEDAAAADDDAATTTPTPLERERASTLEDDESVVAFVLEKHAAKDYFACLNVRRPDCDDLGRAVWDVGDAELNRAFRKASLRVHPDKNRAADARKAFDAIGETQKMFKDPVRRAEVLRAAAERAFKEKCKRDPEAMRARAKAQEKVDAETYADEMRKQREDAAKKRAAEAKARSAQANRRKRRAESDEEEDALTAMAKSLEAEEEAKKTQNVVGGNGDDDDFAGVVRRKSSKKRFMF
jgi:curved DNA-binding protein CbpA